MTQELSHSANVEQLQLMHTAVRLPRTLTPHAPELVPPQPVARVVLDVSLAHLDRVFEYSVPAALAQDAQPGVRVKIRFAGKDVSGYVLERIDDAEYVGKLMPLRPVVSPESVLTPPVLKVCREIADRYAWVLADVLRLAVPPRHSVAEKTLDAQTVAGRITPMVTNPIAWQRYPAGEAFIHRLRSGDCPAASWLAAPTTDPALDWPATLAQAAHAALSVGRGALVVVPDYRDVNLVDAALRNTLGPDQHVRLTAAQGRQARYTAWLKLLRGHVYCVIGTRAAAWAPVQDLGLVAWWDDGDDLLAELRSPYPHVREVLHRRAMVEHAALLVGGFTRSVTVQQWLESGVVRPVQLRPSRVTVPRVTVVGDEQDVQRFGAAAHAQVPPGAWQVAHDALRHGPVLVQVPRRGYLPMLRCTSCRTPARCHHCHGLLELPSVEQQSSVCRCCGQTAIRWTCVECGDTRLRAAIVGDRRTAEELGRAFPGVLVIRSGTGEVVSTVDDRPALVIATPGAEPVATGGYAATLLLDAWALLNRPVLDVTEEAVRRWLAAAALTRPAVAHGIVVLCGVADGVSQSAIQSLVRWAPDWFAERELAERRALDLPPTSWLAVLSGASENIIAFADAVEQQLPQQTTVQRLGPIGADGVEFSRLMLRASLTEASVVAHAVAVVQAARSARKVPRIVSVRVDPSGALL